MAIVSGITRFHRGWPPSSTRLSRIWLPRVLIRMRAAHVAGERKIVTTLFADVVGSAAIAERIDAEEWTGIMNRAFERLTPAIVRYDGTLGRLMGDALLAFFGAPVAHEDDPIRAV